MEKTEAVSRLKKAGYQVQLDSSIVTVLLPAAVSRNQELKKLRAFFQDIGYDASFGIRQVKEVHSDEEEPSEEAKQPEAENIAEENVQDTESEAQTGNTWIETGEQFSLKDFGIM